MRCRAFLLITVFLLGWRWAGAVEYPPVVPGYEIQFPKDEGSHPEFRTEWWYVTGWLEDDKGQSLGFQVTFFRSRPGLAEDNPSKFAPRQLLFAHAAVSDPSVGKLVHAERSAREGFGLARAVESKLDVAIDDWSLRSVGASRGARYVASIVASDISLQLEFVLTQAPLLQGREGFSRKGPNPRAASYYYSLPHLRTTGGVRVNSQQYTVRGNAWMDHEWSSEVLDAQAQGWDWVGVNLDDGGALMVARIRSRQGGSLWATGTLRPAHSSATVQFTSDDVEWSAQRHWRSARTGIEYPVEWQVQAGDRELLLQPLFDDQENDARGSTGTIYWEGAVRVSDRTSGKRIGKGYLEMTGYGDRMRLQ